MSWPFTSRGKTIEKGRDNDLSQLGVAPTIFGFQKAEDSFPVRENGSLAEVGSQDFPSHVPEENVRQEGPVITQIHLVQVLQCGKVLDQPLDKDPIAAITTSQARIRREATISPLSADSSTAVIARTPPSRTITRSGQRKTVPFCPYLPMRQESMIRSISRTVRKVVSTDAM